MKKKVLDYFIVYLGCFIQAFAITCILKPNNLTVGGITGLSLTIGEIIYINYTYIYYFICLLILFTAKIFLGNKEARKIILLSTTYPLILMFMNNFRFNFLSDTPDKLLICIYYGIFMGVGTGLVLKKGFSQGSSDTLSKVIQKKLFPFIGINQVMLCIDIFILLLSSFVFGKTAVLYAIIIQMVYSKSISVVLFGFGSSLVKVVILSDKKDEIEKFLVDKIHRRYSIGFLKGRYKEEKREKIISICSLREAMLIKDFISKIDVDAFINFVPIISAWGRDNGLEKLELDIE